MIDKCLNKRPLGINSFQGEPMDKDYVPITRCDGSGSDGGPPDQEDRKFFLISV